MKTIYYTASSLDGFLADENNALDWLFQWGEPSEECAAFVREIGAIAMGATTYEWILEHQIHATPPQPWDYQVPVWVFSSRDLPSIEGADIRFARGDVRPVHTQMQEAAKGKNLWLMGGGELVGQFHDAGLLDELIVTFASVTLGQGAPLLPRNITFPPLRLLSVRQWGEGFAELRYEVPRPLKTS